MKQKKHILLLLFTLTLLFSETLFARETWSDATRKINYKNSTLVPPFCQVNSPRYNGAKWKKRFGGDFTWINHYCDAKAKIPVCRTYLGKARIACLAKRLEDVNYSIIHAKNPNYPLLPFLYTEQGVLQKDIGQFAQAISSFQTAISKNPKYIRAYAKLSDTYAEMKEYTEAKKVLEQGLKKKKSKALRRRLKKINKKLGITK